MSRQKHEEILKDPVRQKLINGVEKIVEHHQNILMGLGVVALIMVIAHFRDISVKESTLEANTQFGKSQNLFINGQTDLVEGDFKDIIETYGNETAANMSGLYLASHAYNTGDMDIAESYLEDIKDEITVDPIQSGIYAMLASINMDREDYKQALEFYSTAKKLTSLNDFKIKYEIGQILAFQAMENHEKAVDLSRDILDMEDLKYSFKNTVEELLAFSSKKAM